MAVHDKQHHTNHHPHPEKRLYRSNTNKVIAGVAGGLGEYFNVDPVIFRLAFLFFTLAGGGGILLYIILWIILPAHGQRPLTNEKVVRDNIEEIKQRVDSIKNGTNGGNWFGILILLIGIVFLANNFQLFNQYDMGKMWPLILIIIGLLVLSRNR